MTIRCGCPDEGDDIVFGPAHQCARPRTLNDYSVLLYGPCPRDPDCRFPDGHGGPHEPRERPYERVLSDGDGDLG